MVSPYVLFANRQIMNDVNAKFENVDAVALDALEEVLLTPLESVYDLEKHVSRLTRYIMISTNSGFPASQLRNTGRSASFANRYKASSRLLVPRRRSMTLIPTPNDTRSPKSPSGCGTSSLLYSRRLESRKP
jgi:hypothetical protein